MCFNVFMYADDILLASISVAELQQMINIVKSELKWLDMVINVKNIYEGYWAEAWDGNGLRELAMWHHGENV